MVVSRSGGQSDWWSFGIGAYELHSVTSHFDSLVKSALSYWLATLQHIPHVQSAFYGNSASYCHRSTVLMASLPIKIPKNFHPQNLGING